MDNLENISLIASIVALGFCFVFSLFSFIARKDIIRTIQRGNTETATVRTFTPMGRAWIIVAGLALLFITISIISRAIASGHGPFSNMYEFSVAFAWGIVVMSLFFLRKYRTAAIGAIGVTMALGLLIFANTLPSKIIPLVPALQQSILLSVHVACAIISYGALAVGFGAAVIYLITYKRNVSWMPQPDVLDRISYNTVIIGFPFLTLTIILGAVWANIAWGRPWAWDPKETASLVTWLIFVAYLHARIIRGWRGTRCALLLVAGFVAVLFTFFGNYIFGGLHSYR
jgi:cytochrome c-type biogenesis protein CcsB